MSRVVHFLVDIRRNLDQAQILRLAACAYIKEKHNIIIMGASGSGKSYLACAFGIAACQNFYTVKYIRLPELLIELDIARNEGSYKKLMNQNRKVHSFHQPAGILRLVKQPLPMRFWTVLSMILI